MLSFHATPPMRVMVFASQKGGSGKTTLAGHVAVEAERSGGGPEAGHRGARCWQAGKGGRTVSHGVVLLQKAPSTPARSAVADWQRMTKKVR